MRTLHRLFGLLLLGLLTGLLMFSASSCETTRRREQSDPTRAGQSISNADAALSGAASSRQIMQLTAAGVVDYKTPQSVLASALVRQFHDGTVIDRVLVRKAPGNAKDKPAYFLIGMGLNNGRFRAMALPLRGTDDGTFYLTPNADRYVLSSTGCPTCYFDFEEGQIVGTTCDDNVGGNTCTLQILTANEVFVRR